MNYNDELIQKNEQLYAKMRMQLINEQKQANGLYVIDGTSNQISGESIDNINNLPLSKENYEDQLAIVHATNYFPKNHQAVCREDAGLIFQNKCYSHRTTVHTTINNMVDLHAYGNWDKCKFIIIEPFNTQKQRVMGMSFKDTYFSRYIDLTNRGIILVNESAYNELSDEEKANNNIMLFNGNNKVATMKALIMMGYKPQYIGIDNDKNKQNNAYENNYNLFQEYFKSHNYDSGAHMYTMYHQIESDTLCRDEFLSDERNKFIDTKSNDLQMTPEEVYKLYETDNVSNHGLSFANFLINYGIKPDDNNYYALTSDKAIKISQKYHKTVASDDIDKEKLEEDYKNEYKKLLELVKRREEDRLMNQILPKNPQDFDDKEKKFSNKVIESILKSNSNEKYSFDRISNNIQIYDNNGNDEQLWDRVAENNMADYQVLMETYLIKKEPFYNTEKPFYETIKNLNQQINITKQDLDRLYKIQIAKNSGKSYGISTINGLILIMGFCISLITIMIMIIK